MRRASIVRDYGSDLIRVGSMVVIAFFLTPILLQELGQAAFGMWRLILAVMLYVVIFETALRASMQRFLAEAIGRKHIVDSSRVVGTVATISFPLVAIPALAMLYFAPNIVSSTLKETEPLFHESVTAIRLVTIATAITSISAFLGAILQAMRRIDLANLIGVPLLWLRFILFVVIALKGGGLVALGWANVAMSLFSLFWFVIFISRVLKGQGILSRSAIRPGRIHGLGRFIFYSGIAKLGDLIRNQSTILLLGLAALGGAPSVAAIFALVSTLTKTSSQAIVGFADSASPRLARFASSPDEMRPMIASFGAVLGAMFSAFAFAFFFLGAPFITLWAPPDDYMDLLVPFMQLVSAIFMVRAGRMMINRPLRALNRMEYTGVGQLIESVLTLALAIILMLSMGVLGVLVARLAVSSVYLLIAAPLIMRKVALIEYRDYYWGCYCRPFLAAALGAIPLAIMVMNVKIDSWLTLVGVGFPGCVLMCVTIYFIGIDREKRREIMSRVRDVSGT